MSKCVKQLTRGNAFAQRHSVRSAIHSSTNFRSATTVAGFNLDQDPRFGMGKYQSKYPLATNAPKTAAVGSLVNSWTEWQPLQEVIVGVSEKSCFPANEPAFDAKLKSADHALFSTEAGFRSEDSIDKGHTELEGLVSALERNGVTVRRPDVIDWSKPHATPDFASPCGNTGAMPRDVLLTVGNEIVESTMSWRARFFEYRAYRTLLNEYFERDPNFVWSSGPKPTMADHMYHTNFPHESKGEMADMQRERLAAHRIYVHTEAEPIFDAADCMRFGRDIFVCNSFTTNRKGYDWLRRHFNQRGIRVHFLDFPQDTAPMHIDVLFTPLSKDTVLLNPARPPRPWVERLLQMNGWKIIKGVSNGIPTPPLSQCSEWLALNVLSIDDKRVLVEEQETKMMDVLAKNGFEPIPVALRSIAEFGGAFHCCTADVRRAGELESYFPHIDELEARGLDCQFAPFGADAPAVYAEPMPSISVPYSSTDTPSAQARAYSSTASTKQR